MLSPRNGYLANSSMVVTTAGEVLLVESITTETEMSFHIYKNDPSLQSNGGYYPPLLEVDSVGDEALFLDLGITMPANHSLSIKPNSIYFTRHNRAGLRKPSNLNICVFNLATNTLKRYKMQSVNATVTCSCQAALKWAVDSLLTPGETLTLVHQPTPVSLEMTMSRICFIHSGASAPEKTRFKAADVTSTVMKGAPSFCTVYAISRGKISSVKWATSSPLLSCTIRPELSASNNSIPRATIRQRPHDEIEIKGSVANSDISFMSSDRPRVDWMFPTPCLSVSSEFDESRHPHAHHKSSP
ncbi:unnamed protein product [Arabis nemorensis]|uniref:RING-type E3 ubiquitin transferase n=1 Tax=Arabis nemorensis TaxID=586526 RepID=A0A565BLC8_9BRAS|nr:unnamed protein product [Arabis nemorensis]